MSNHCKDCCCARSWKALGTTEFDNTSIPEHITELVKTIAYYEAFMSACNVDVDKLNHLRNA